jgi:hypothetical protein
MNIKKDINLEISKDFSNTVEQHSGKRPKLINGLIIALQSQDILFHVEITISSPEKDYYEGKVIISKSTTPTLCGLSVGDIVPFNRNNVFYISQRD